MKKNLLKGFLIIISVLISLGLSFQIKQAISEFAKSELILNSLFIVFVIVGSVITYNMLTKFIKAQNL